MTDIEYFSNNFYQNKDNILILSKNDGYSKNFGKQWKKYKTVQVDSYNNFSISKKFLEKIIFNKLDYLKDKKVLEIGCGSGRFTEYIVKYAKHCVSVDMSEAIFYNVAKNSKNLTLIKADFIKLISKEKFDIVICRGMLQHTPNPLMSLIKLYDFVNTNGLIYFDIYPLPKIGYFHPKYFFWRPLIKSMFSYDKTENFLTKNIKTLLKIKRLIKFIFFNSNFFSDVFVPVWDYKNKIDLDEKQLLNWSILDTMDGLYAYYDNPQRTSIIKKTLNKNNIKIVNYNAKLNCFETRRLFLKT